MDNTEMSITPFERYREAYKIMWRKARYRPAAPGDGCGHVNLTKQELADQDRLEQEATDYAWRFMEEDDKHVYVIGCSNYTTNRALVYTIEAARALTGAADDLAIDLLQLAIDEIRGQRPKLRRVGK
jgi:hypothetical protein